MNEIVEGSFTIYRSGNSQSIDTSLKYKFYKKKQKLLYHQDEQFLFLNVQDPINNKLYIVLVFIPINTLT